MKFSAVFVAVIASVLPALSAPTADTDIVARGELEKRDLSVYVCEGA